MIVKRYFKCVDCGSVLPATSTKRKTGIGHIKDIYCYKCKKIVKSIQEE